MDESDLADAARLMEERHAELLTEQALAEATETEQNETKLGQNVVKLVDAQLLN